ncbi:MAG: response regulator [Burkholderiaceae bacterium]|nr:response regulator [Burkholderiaceae bacterium]
MHSQTVFIVDDDAAVRDSLALLLSLRGYPTAVFGCAEDFLRVLDPQWRGCVVVDIRMPGMSGLDLQAVLAGHPAAMPVIIVTGHGDIAAARQAFKAAAIDFLEKPFDDDALVEAIERAFAGAAAGRDDPVWPIQASLSPREREVMRHVVDGLDNRSIGSLLGISARTVEVHKSRLMAKLGVRGLADLIRLASQRR